MTSRDNRPSIQENAEFTRRLRELSKAGREADPAERAAFLAEKDALIARIEAGNRTAAVRAAVEQVGVDEVLARAEGGGYAMVGPSGRTWSVDPATGVPLGPVPEAEHRMVRDLMAQERLDGAEPAWLRCTHGSAEIVAAVVPFRDDDRSEAPLAGYPDEVGAVDPRDTPADVDGRLLPPWPAGTIPPEMLDGIEERRTAPAQQDDPAEIRARLDGLREEIHQRNSQPATDTADDDAGRGW